MRPFVSVVTPTYNRRRFIPALIEIYKAQTYPKDRMEWLILDDGDDPVEDLFEAAAKTIPNIRYMRRPPKLLIGKKRNILNQEAKGEIIVAMDDDDYYTPERVAHAVTKLMAVPSVELAGSSEIYIYYSDNKKIYKFGPYHKFHATNGTMAWKRSYSLTHSYDETVTHAEESSFLEKYIHPMIQLDIEKVMLVISHSENTYDKKKLREQQSPFVKETSMKIKQFIKDSKLREFFASA
jgi:glycosyltransferase involved in cell wall biosynthesis